jgi:NAD(P)-dependent dehydrogenase (short-subunit alcohol dehydrogenase family)
VHLVPLRAARQSNQIDLNEWRESLPLEVKSLFLLAQLVEPDLEQSRGARLLAASVLGGGFGLNSFCGAIHPGHGGIGGMIRSLAQEWPKVSCKVVDLDASLQADALATLLLEELETDDPDVCVGRPKGLRLHVQPVAVPHETASSPPVTLDSNSVVLITGGARGITAAAAEELAQRFRSTLILAGRSPAPPPEESRATARIVGMHELKAILREELRSQGQFRGPAGVEAAYRRLLQEREMRGALDNMQRAGARIEYHQVDVRDAAAVGRLVADIYSTHGRLDGVIHGAGVIRIS